MHTSPFIVQCNKAKRFSLLYYFHVCLFFFNSNTNRTTFYANARLTMLSFPMSVSSLLLLFIHHIIQNADFFIDITVFLMHIVKMNNFTTLHLHILHLYIQYKSQLSICIFLQFSFLNIHCHWSSFSAKRTRHIHQAHLSTKAPHPPPHALTAAAASTRCHSGACPV